MAHMDLQSVSESVVSVILTLPDHKNLYSRNHAFSSRFNGCTITNCTGLAFEYQRDIYVLCDGNMFAPYLVSSSSSSFSSLAQTPKLSINAQVVVQFNQQPQPQPRPLQPPPQHAAQLVYAQHLHSLQSSIESMEISFKFGHVTSPGPGVHDKFAYLVLLKLTHATPSLLPRVWSLHALQSLACSPSDTHTLIGRPIFSVSSPFGVLCSNVLHNNVYHGTLSTYVTLPTPHRSCVWLSDMKYFPGMEGALVVCSASAGVSAGVSVVGILSVPLLIAGHHGVTSLTTILPCATWLSWLVPLVNMHASNQNQNATKISSPRLPPGLHLTPSNASHSAAANSHDPRPNAVSAVYDASKCVVPICVGSHWGSAILIAHDHLLTNAHIVRPYLNNASETDYVQRVRFRHPLSRSDAPRIGVSVSTASAGSAGQQPVPRQWLRCKLVFVAHSNSPWDVAWLRIVDYDAEKYKPFLPCVTLPPTARCPRDMHALYKQLFARRADVFAVGYGLIHPSKGLSPFVSAGVLSKVVCADEDETVVMLKCSADIHAGHSGGLLCNARGQCLGLLTNNSVFDFDSDKNAMDTWEKQELWSSDQVTGQADNCKDKGKATFVYPNLNSVVPFSVVYDLYQCVVDGAHGADVEKRMLSVFAALDKPNEAVQAKWNLVSPEKLQHQVEYDRRMQCITDSIPKNLLHAKNIKSKL